jgi:hypothetical protein
MRIKFAFSALALMVAMTMATSAFAQSVFSISSGIQPRGREHGHAELAGGVTLARTSGAIVEAGTVVIDYGVPITNEVGNAVLNVNTMANEISVLICNNTPAGNAAATKVSGNKITITVADTVTCDALDTRIDVSGVRLSLVGSGADTVTASVTATGGVRLTGSNRITVIDTIADELTDDGVTVKDKVTLVRHTGKPAGKAQFKLIIEENTVDAFQNAQLNLEFSGIPEDISVVVDAWVTTVDNLEKEIEPGMTLVPVVGEADSRMNDQLYVNKALTETVTGEDNKVVVQTDQFTIDAAPDATPAGLMHTGGMLSDDDKDAIIILGTVKGAEDDDLLPLQDIDIQITAEVGPRGSKGDTDVPRFSSNQTDPVTVIASMSAQTKMMVPFVHSSGTLGGIDTGVAIANMSSSGDAQPGTITFDFYGGGTKTSYTTGPGSPGDGLNSSGMLVPGATYAALLSSLLDAAGLTGAFSGYMTITANFLDGDANIYISDFERWGTTGTVRILP